MFMVSAVDRLVRVVPASGELTPTAFSASGATASVERRNLVEKNVNVS